MAFKYWNGSQWCACSSADADVHRARGRRVIERPIPAPAAPDAPIAPPAKPAAKPAPKPDISEAELEKLTAPKPKP
jgi:hypothetical protein